MFKSVYFAIWLGLVSVTLTISNSAFSDPFDWNVFDQALQKHVKPEEVDGIPANLVDYQALKASGVIESIAKQLDSYAPDFENHNEALSFYINAYNFFAIKMVTDHYPVDSIKDIGNFIFPVWKKTVGKINGKNTSLDHIEHEVLRPMGEPRIHFAIVCASLSCPDLRPSVYTSKDLDQQLNEQATRFFAQSKGLQVNQNKITVSKIFDWFEVDFKETGGVSAYIERYRPGLPSTEVSGYLSYDWRLNDQ